MTPMHQSAFRGSEDAFLRAHSLADLARDQGQLIPCPVLISLPFLRPHWHHTRLLLPNLDITWWTMRAIFLAGLLAHHLRLSSAAGEDAERVPTIENETLFQGKLVKPSGNLCTLLTHLLLLALRQCAPFSYNEDSNGTHPPLQITGGDSKGLCRN